MRPFSTALHKLFLLVFNFSFVVTGLLLMVIGLVIRGQYQRFQDFLSDNFFSLPSILIYTSVVLVFTALLGCCGTVQENKFMIGTYCVLVCLLFTTEIAVGLTGYALSDDTHNILRYSLNNTMQLYNRSYEITKVWDSLQTNLHCCGIDSYSDWYSTLNDSIPMSCCETQLGAIGVEICDQSSSTLYQSSCLDALTTIIKDNASTLAIVALGMASVQLLGIYFSCSLMSGIRNHYENFT